MVLSSVMLSPWPSIHAGSAATATTRSVSVGRLPGPAHSEHAAVDQRKLLLDNLWWTVPPACAGQTPGAAEAADWRGGATSSAASDQHIYSLQFVLLQAKSYWCITFLSHPHPGMVSDTTTDHISQTISGKLLRACVLWLRIQYRISNEAWHLRIIYWSPEKNWCKNTG